MTRSNQECPMLAFRYGVARTLGRDMALRHCYYTLSVSVLLTVSAHAQIPVVRADFVRTFSRAASDEPAIVEHGHHLFSEDGRVRKDTFRGDEHVAEIVLPPRLAEDDGLGSELGRRLRIDYTRRVATWDTTGYSIPTIGTDGLPQCSGWRQAPSFRGQTRDGPVGRCSIGPFVLTGFADARTHPHSGDSYATEWWVFVNTPTEDLAERRTVTSEGSVDELRLTRITHTSVQEEAFDMPAGYRVVDLQQWYGVGP